MLRHTKRIGSRARTRTTFGGARINGALVGDFERCCYNIKNVNTKANMENNTGRNLKNRKSDAGSKREFTPWPVLARARVALCVFGGDL